MSHAAAGRWRIGLSIGVVLLLAVAVASGFVSLYCFHVHGTLGGNDFAIKRAAVYYTHRPARAAPGAVVPGWRVFTEPYVKRPKVALLPTAQVGRSAGGGWSGTFCFPLWIPLLAGAIPCFMLWRRRLRPPAHCCRRCGYDLRGTPGTICPECGRTSAG